jgi:hypothetical protein
MIIAMGPVTVDGRIFSITSLPQALTRKPAAMETRPDITMPNCAIASTFSAGTPTSCSEALRPRIAARYEKLDP